MEFSFENCLGTLEEANEKSEANARLGERGYLLPGKKVVAGDQSVFHKHMYQ